MAFVVDRSRHVVQPPRANLERALSTVSSAVNRFSQTVSSCMQAIKNFYYIPDNAGGAGHTLLESRTVTEADLSMNNDVSETVRKLSKQQYYWGLFPYKTIHANAMLRPLFADQINCPICLLGFEVGDVITGHNLAAENDTTHAAHDICNANWLNHKSSCAQCREPITTPGLVKSRVLHTIAIVISIAEIFLYCVAPASPFLMPFSFTFLYLHYLQGYFVAKKVQGITIVDNILFVLVLEMMGNTLFHFISCLPPYMTTLNLLVAMTAMYYNAH